MRTLYRELRRVRQDAAAAARSRSCGTCSACCTTHGVDVLEKPAGVRCSLLRPEKDAGAGRCSIYDRRPRDCDDWSCVWRRGGLEAHERPDRVGVVVDVVGEDPEVVEVAEVWPGALRGEDTVRLVARMRALAEVRERAVAPGDRRRLPLAP